MDSDVERDILDTLSVESNPESLASRYDKMYEQILAGELPKEKFIGKMLDLESQADHDRLTDLLNLRGFLREMERVQADIERHNRKSVMLGLDVDKFKRVNDTFGHDTGDGVLKIYAQVIGSSVRDGDITARTGGDEFTVVLLDCDEENGLNIAERIRKAIIDQIKGEFPKLGWEQTVSIGIATFRIGQSLENWRKQADVALFNAKIERNKTMVFTQN